MSMMFSSPVSIGFGRHVFAVALVVLGVGGGAIADVDLALARHVERVGRLDRPRQVVVDAGRRARDEACRSAARCPARRRRRNRCRSRATRRRRSSRRTTRLPVVKPRTGQKAAQPVLAAAKHVFDVGGPHAAAAGPWDHGPRDLSVRAARRPTSCSKAFCDDLFLGFPRSGGYMGNAARAQTLLPLQRDGVTAYLFKAENRQGANSAWLTRRARMYCRALDQVIDPVSGRSVVQEDIIQGLVLRDGNVGFAVEVDPPARPRCRTAAQAPARTRRQALPGVLSVTAVLTAHQNTAQPQRATARERRHLRPREFPASTRSSRWRAAKAASANRRSPSILRSRSASSD